jgi:hypothetical protein
MPTAAALTAPAWLGAVADADRVTTALRHLLVGRHEAGGAPTGRAADVRCELLDLRARGATWRVRYRTEVDWTSGGRSRLLLVGDVDPRPVPFSGAADAGTTLPGLRVDRCRARSVRYLHGERCTVVLELELAGAGAGPTLVVAKAHANGAGAGVDAAMRALWATSLAGGDVVRLAEPLGYLPDPGVLVQGAVPGDATVRELLAAVGGGGDPGRAREVLVRVADGLAAVHACGVQDAPLRTWADDLQRVRRTAARVAPGWPAAAEQVLTALEVLEGNAAASRSATGPRPAHGAFRPSQVLVDGDTVGFIDFDGFCLAEPERDLGRFCKALRKVVVPPQTAPPADRARAAVGAEHLVDAFLSRYAEIAPMSVERVAAWEALDQLAGQAHRAATVRAAAVASASSPVGAPTAAAVRARGPVLADPAWPPTT